MESMNRFSFNPANLDILRSVFDRSTNRYQTFLASKLVPFYFDEVLPGDSCTIKTNAFLRMKNPILPAMDPLYCDIFYFFVPMRLIWNNYKQFFGENDSTAWTRSTMLELPHLDSTSIAAMQTDGDYKSGSLLDYLGVHLGPDDAGTATDDAGTNACALDSLEGINTLPIRAYYAICQEWFNDQNYAAPLAYSKGDSGRNDYYLSTVYLSNGDDPVNYGSDIHRGGIFNVFALHDYFTSVLPAPQKSADVIPVGSYQNPFGTADSAPWYVPVSAMPTEHIDSGDNLSAPIFRAIGSNGQAGSATPADTILGVKTSGQLFGFSGITGTNNGYQGITNLYASLPASVFASVNQIRYAFALQRFFEKDARGGTRYREKIKAHFGVTGSDSAMMVPEYLGGERFMLNMDTILTTADTSTGATGEYAGYSKTFQSIKQFSKSFSEHGYILGLMCVRAKKTYHQGIPKAFTRKDQLDFYWPTFANLGEQPVYEKEIYADASYGNDDDVFGYNEPYAEYRYKPSELCGSLRPESSAFIRGYTYAEQFINQGNATALNNRRSWADAVAQNLAVPGGTHFISMIHVDGKWRRPLPVYSIPGLVDHH